MDSEDVLLAIPSPRDIRGPLESLEDIDYVDKLWTKYMSVSDAYNTIRDFFLQRKYELLVLATDDITFPYFSVAQLIRDLVRHPEIRVLAGVCNLGSVTKLGLSRKLKIIGADILQDILHGNFAKSTFKVAFDKHYAIHHINVSYEPVVSSEREAVRTLSQYRFPCSHVIFDEERIQKVWYMGGPAIVRRDVVEKIAFRGYQGNRMKLLDVAFALDCQNAGIEIYADFNVVVPHHQHYDRVLVGKRPAYTKFERHRRQIDVSH